MRTNILATVAIILLLILSLDVFSNNSLSKFVAEVLTKVSFPFYGYREKLENFFEKYPSILHVTLFSENAKALTVLSEDIKGLYVRNLHEKGLVIDPLSKQLIGFVERTGKIGYVRKWWVSEFPVTIEGTETRAVGFYRKFRIEVPDPYVDIGGKVYLADSEEYGRLMRLYNISIGVFKNGYFLPKIPTIPKYVVILPSYHNGSRKQEEGGN